MKTSGEPASLYVHVPFCIKKCDYCHFFVLPFTEAGATDLVDALLLEWERVRHRLETHRLVSIYFGGGTPALLQPCQLQQLLSRFKEGVGSQDPEITLEANPEHVTPQLLKAYAKAGINRISFGVQSFDRKELTLLSRQHTPEEAKRAVFDALKAGIENVSIDLMYEIPKQTLASWKATLTAACALPVTHVSLYNLTIEPGTSFFKRRQALAPSLPTERVAKEMLDEATATLTRHGFERYELSAFAKDGRVSTHNSGYWTMRPFLGLGPSAFSYWEGERYQNAANMRTYQRQLRQGACPVHFRERLEGQARQRERLAVSLRMLRGVDLDQFGARSPQLERDIQSICEMGLCERDSSTLRLSEKGLLYYDSVAAMLI